MGDAKEAENTKRRKVVSSEGWEGLGEPEEGFVETTVINLGCVVGRGFMSAQEAKGRSG